MRKTCHDQKLATFSIPPSSEEGEGLETVLFIHHTCVRKPKQKSLRYTVQRGSRLAGTCMTGSRVYHNSKGTEAPGLRSLRIS